MKRTSPQKPGLLAACFCVRPAVKKSKKGSAGGDPAVDGLCIHTDGESAEVHEK